MERALVLLRCHMEGLQDAIREAMDDAVFVGEVAST